MRPTPCPERPAPVDAARAGRRERGFSLAEMIVVIVVTGILATVVAVFIQKPVEGYFDSVRRAELTDIADTALRRIGRDLRTALPNSVTVTTAGSTYTVSFTETTGGGRYRAAVTSAGTGDELDFTAADTSFEVIDPNPAASVAHSPGSVIVVGNFGSGTGGSSGYNGLAGNVVNMDSVLFPAESPGRRFHVARGTVAYTCSPAPVGGTLTRSGTLLASDVTGCAITYESSIAATRTGVVSLWLTLTRGGESVSLFHQVHVSNTP